MKERILIFLIVISTIIIFLTSCSSEYEEQLKEYKVLLDGTVKLLDSERVYESIKDNNLKVNFEKLDDIFKNMEKHVPDDRIHEFIVLRTEHEFLQEVVEKGLEWNSLNNLDKLSIAETIIMFKGSQE